MTQAQKKKAVEYLISAALALVSSIFLLFGTGAWDSKESAIDHAADFAAVVEMQQRTLDVVCDGQKLTERAKRACSSPAPVLRVKKK
jgi:predicted Rossmann-fold nucleotide-binding protein